MQTYCSEHGNPVAAGHRIGQPEVLFRIIDDQEVVSLRTRFAGSQAEQRSRAAVRGSTARSQSTQSSHMNNAKSTASSSSPAVKQTRQQAQV